MFKGFSKKGDKAEEAKDGGKDKDKEAPKADEKADDKKEDKKEAADKGDAGKEAADSKDDKAKKAGFWGFSGKKDKDDKKDGDEASKTEGEGKAAAAAPAAKADDKPKEKEAAKPKEKEKAAAEEKPAAEEREKSKEDGGADAAEVAQDISHRLDVNFQLGANLWKKDTAGSNKWDERYFMLKDGFLLYYDKQKAAMTKVDMHPKGVVPLEGVDVEVCKAGPTKALMSGFRVTHPSFGAKSLLLCAHDDRERDAWVAGINEAKKCTYASTISALAATDAIRHQLTEARGAAATAAKRTARMLAQVRGMLTAVAAAEATHGVRIYDAAALSAAIGEFEQQHPLPALPAGGQHPQPQPHPQQQAHDAGGSRHGSFLSLEQQAPQAGSLASGASSLAGTSAATGGGNFLAGAALDAPPPPPPAISDFAPPPPT